MYSMYEKNYYIKQTTVGYRNLVIRMTRLPLFTNRRADYLFIYYMYVKHCAILLANLS